MDNKFATFGAGCFWGVEAAFRKLDGVIDTTVGYAGGDVNEPTYEQVCSGNTGYAEVCQVEFDLGKISYEELLAAFWKMHDPTQLNRQGPDVGYQYRSVIFTHDEQQQKIAEDSLAALPNTDLIATTIESATTFWPAEEYHQRYLEKNGQATC